MKVLYVQYADPALYPPVERSASIFKRAGFQVSFLGISAVGQSAKVVSDTTCRDNIELLEHEVGGFSAIRSYLRFWFRTISRVRRERPDVIYCSDVLAYPGVLIASYFSAGRIIMHEHDLPPVNKSFLNSMLGWCRRRLARRAEVCVLPQAQRAVRFQQQTNVKPVVVLNCPSLCEIESSSGQSTSYKTFTLWHHGSIGPEQLPLELLEALAKLPEHVRLEFAGYETSSHSGYIDFFLGQAEKLKVRHRIVAHDAMPRAALYEKARTCDVGLVLFDRNYYAGLAGASNKPFDYLACNLPLLTNDTEEWRDFFEREGVSVVCNPRDSQSIFEAVSLLLDDPRKCEEIISTAKLLLRQNWNYEHQFSSVMSELCLFPMSSTGASEVRGSLP